jgi:hypothetical protein
LDPRRLAKRHREHFYDGTGRRVQDVSTYNIQKVFVYDVFGQAAAEYSLDAQSLPCTTCYIATDHLGSTRTVPAVGNAVATTGRIARGAIALDHGIAKPIVPIASGAYLGYGAITENPENQLDNFIGWAPRA